jgi:hypothetical protein
MSKRTGLLLLLVAFVIFAGLFAFWHFYYKQPSGGGTPPDMAAALEHNSRGAALMEQFEYKNAADEFEQVNQLAPDWTPGKINLGIALLNQNNEEAIQKAIDIFAAVLKKEPDNLHAHYCLGLLLMYHRDFVESVPHFEAVTKKDPNDAGAWYHLGYVLSQRGDDAPRTLECLENAHRLNPYMSGPLANLPSRLADDPKRSDELVNEDRRLRLAHQLEFVELKYTFMGSPYARAISHPDQQAAAKEEAALPLFMAFPKFEVKLAPGAKWAGPGDLGEGALGDLRRVIRRRFGATIITLDYNRDGKPDLFLIGAVVENGKLRDLLLRNDGDGVFTDVTAEAGLAGERPSLGCAAADFDNDKFPDLVITGAGKQFLFHNMGDGKFEDVSAKAGLDKVTDVCLGCAWFDLDQDGDLDLLLARYADTTENAVAMFAGRGTSKGGVAVFLNTGEALARSVAKGSGFGALSVAFKRSPEIEKLFEADGSVVTFAVTDADGDTDLDVLVLADLNPAALVINERVGRFRKHFLEAAATGQVWNGVVALDVDQDERSDLLLLSPGQKPVLLMNRSRAGMSPAKLYEKVELDAPALRQAHAVDIDLDGRPDVVGLSDDGHLVLLRNNRKGGLDKATELPGVEKLTDLVAGLPLDLDGDGFPDLLVWHESAGLTAFRSQGNGNKAVKLRLVGRRENASPPGERVNNDGIGARVTVQVGGNWTTAEHVSTSSGLGHSSAPMLLGLGRGPAEKATVRARWPDMVPQAEFLNDPKNEYCGIEKEGVWELRETNRKPTSCPLLFTWDGDKWVFATDCLGEGSVGELLAEGGTRPGRPEESVKLDANHLRPKDGMYLLRIAEPMDEVTYLDRVRLDVIDLPPGVDVFPDERFATGGPGPTQERLYFRERFFAQDAVDSHGKDVTAVLRERDGKMTGGFAYRSWLGFAEEHFITLDFGDQLAKVGPKQRLYFVAAGWTDYAYPESIFAAKQAGVELIAPVLERQRSDGRWEAVCELGFPAGLPRFLTRDVTGLLAGHKGKLRIRTNMQIYWDQIFLAPAIDGREARVTELGAMKAELGKRGMLREVRTKDSPLIEYDPLKVDRVAVTRWKGFLTRLGDVTELLTDADDRVVILGPGDELTVQFAANVPELPAGWSRQFVLRTWGWCKDASPFTATGGEVGPMPFRAMKQFPPGPGEPYPHPDDLRKWHTRWP